jgi:hypothetical protein
MTTFGKVSVITLLAALGAGMMILALSMVTVWSADGHIDDVRFGIVSTNVEWSAGDGMRVCWFDANC